KLVGTIAVDPGVGTEGFNEPVLVRISRGPFAGRLLCLMRTGRDLYEAYSDDGGATWSSPRPRIFAGLDVHRTELWVDMFRHLKGRSGKLLDEKNPDDLKGAVVDPDLIELRSGMLVATFGVRIPQKACWPHCYHPWNGNYLAVSRDHGVSWTNVVRLTSGVLTTHYTAVEETPNDNEVFVVYDYGYWRQPSRYTYGRTVKITEKPA
ncbi:MAG: sialidase family protein, partial [Opitutaceae bacterium]